MVNIYFAESKSTYRNTSRNIFRPFLAIKIAKNKVDVSTCFHFLKVHYQSEECLQSPVFLTWFTMSAFTFAKLLECFLHAYFRASLINDFSVTIFMVQSSENVSLEVFLCFFASPK